MKQQKQDTDLLEALRSYELLLRNAKAAKVSVKSTHLSTKSTQGIRENEAPIKTEREKRKHLSTKSKQA